MFGEYIEKRAFFAKPPLLLFSFIYNQSLHKTQIGYILNIIFLILVNIHVHEICNKW